MENGTRVETKTEPPAPRRSQRATAPVYSLTSQAIVQDIPKRGEEARTIDATRPARWQKLSKLDDSGAVWDLITRREQTAAVVAYDVQLSATSRNGEQIREWAGAGPCGRPSPITPSRRGKGCRPKLGASCWATASWPWSSEP